MDVLVGFSSRVHSLAQAHDIAGSLGTPSKMPGFSNGLDARACRKGSFLRNVKGSVCASCYALKGRYRFPNVASAQAKRLAALADPLWVDAMVYLLRVYVMPEVPSFRWHDSGDLQSAEHLGRIIEIAERLPDIAFWLPTREVALVKPQIHAAPRNLVIRVSGALVNTDTRNKLPFSQTSGVAPAGLKKDWPALVASNTHKCHHCPSALQGGRCGNCRACWDPKIEHVVYLEH